MRLKSVIAILFLSLLAITLLANQDFCRLDGQQVRYAPDWLYRTYFVTNVYGHTSSPTNPVPPEYHSYVEYETTNEVVEVDTFTNCFENVSTTNSYSRLGWTESYCYTNVDEEVSPPSTNILTDYTYVSTNVDRFARFETWEVVEKKIPDLSPSADLYLSQGWKREAILPATPPPGYHTVSKELYVDGDSVKARYEYEEDVPVIPVRSFSKLKLMGALVQLGKWTDLKEWLQGQTIEGVNGYEAFMLAQDLKDDHPLFNILLAQAKAALGIDDATADAILEGCELDE